MIENLQLMIDDHLDRHHPAHTFPGGRGDGFVMGIGPGTECTPEFINEYAI